MQLAPALLPPAAYACTLPTRSQTATEVFFRKARFWDGEGKDAPPAFHVDGVQYLHVKVWRSCCRCCCLLLALALLLRLQVNLVLHPLA